MNIDDIHSDSDQTITDIILDESNVSQIETILSQCEGPINLVSKLSDDGSLPEIVFSFNNIISLDLSENNLSHLSPEIVKLSNLKILNISNNHFLEIPNHIFDISKLEELWLNNNIIETIPDRIGKLITLKLLFLSDNPIHTIFPVIFKLKNLVVLSISGAKLTSLSSEIKNLTELKFLNFSENELTTLPLELFNLKKLSNLSLSYNHLTSIPSEIENLTELEYLNLNKNELTTLPLELFNLKKLSNLYLSNNRLTSIPDEIENLTELTDFFFNSNDLTTLPPELFKLKKLEKLSIYKTNLTIIPPEIESLSNLTHLNIAINEFTRIPPEIFKLINLTFLDLAYTKLDFVPLDISQLSKLKHLDLSYNNINNISSDIFKLSELNILDIAFCNISSIPSDIKNLKNLESLRLSDNQISYLPYELFQLVGLKELLIDNNQFTIISSEIGNLKNLIQLNLSNNDLLDLPSELFKLTKLQLLNISHNKLSSISSDLNNLKYLEELNLSGNKLLYLPDELFELRHLIKLNLENIDLTNLSPQILNLKKLDELILFNNPLVYPPVEIASRGVRSIFEYIIANIGETENLREIKLLIVGDGGVGKTSLLKRLQGKSFDKYENQTHGINIGDIKLNNVVTHIWDFGGQQILHATHQFFLSKRSFYILVIDGREEENPEYWLKHIESFGGESPIFIVINKIDQNPSFDVNRNFLKTKYPNIKNFFKISCQTNKGLSELENELKSEISRTPHLQTKWPLSWFSVKKTLELESKDYFDYNEFLRICKDNYIFDDHSKEVLSEFLHDLGIVLHFKDIKLIGTYVLNPHWITNGVYKIITSPLLAINNGFLDFDSLEEIFCSQSKSKYHYVVEKLESVLSLIKKSEKSTYKYPKDKYEFLISVMIKFELCFEIESNSSTFLVPSLLGVQEPEIKDLIYPFYDKILRFQIQYEYLPKSIISRFIVKMHKYIKKLNDQRLCWRTGLVIETKQFDETISTIIFDEDKNIVYINIYGHHRKDELTFILCIFREINNTFTNLVAIEKIILPDNDKIAVDYKHLLTLMENGIYEFIPEGSSKKYIVGELLGEIQIEIDSLKSDENLINLFNAVFSVLHPNEDLNSLNSRTVESTFSTLKPNLTKLNKEELSNEDDELIMMNFLKNKQKSKF